MTGGSCIMPIDVVMGRGHQIDDDKGQKQSGADAKTDLQLAQEIGGRDDAHAEILRTRRTRLVRQFDEKREVFFAGVFQHEMAHGYD